LLAESRQLLAQKSQHDAAVLEVEHQAKEAALLLGDSLASESSSDLQIERDRLQSSQSNIQKLEQDLQGLQQQHHMNSQEIEQLIANHQDAISLIKREHEADIERLDKMAQSDKELLKQQHLEFKSVCATLVLSDLPCHLARFDCDCDYFLIFLF
jgi:uncharacterized protein YoxC